MEPASVLAFILAGLKSAKIVHAVLSALSDAPDVVRKAVLYAQQVWQILDQCRENITIASDETMTADFMSCIASCASLEAKIKRLKIQPGNGMATRLWKRLRSVVDEDDLQRFCTDTARGLAALQLRLQVDSSNVLSETRAIAVKTRQDVKSLGAALLSTAVVHSAKMAAVEETVLVGMESKFASLSMQVASAQASIQASLTNMALVSQSKVERVPDFVKRVNEESRRFQRTLIQNLPPLPHIVESLRSLVRLVRLKTVIINPQSTDNDLVNHVIDHFEIIVRAARAQPRANEYVVQLGKGVKITHLVEAHKLWYTERPVIRRLGLWSLALNGPAPPSPLTSTQGPMVLKAGWVSIEGRVGTFYFDMMIWAPAGKPDNRIASQQSAATRACPQGSQVFHAIRFTFIPHDGSIFPMVSAASFQGEMPGGLFSSSSRLDFNRALPAASPVFRAVQDGRFDDFRKMLDSGEASVRDHDEFGASLLFYAVEQPEICAFLISQGLDVHLSACPKGVIDHGGERFFPKPFEREMGQMLSAQRCPVIKFYRLIAGQPNPQAIIASNLLEKAGAGLHHEGPVRKQWRRGAIGGTIM